MPDDVELTAERHGHTTKLNPSRTVRHNEKLSCATASAFGFFRMPLSGIDLCVRPARSAVYVTALNQSLLTHSMIVSVCKSCDFLLGFIVGTTSDNVSTRWGRRKPWVIVCFPFSILAMLLLVYPFPFAASALSSDDGSSRLPCGDVAAASPASCAALELCLRQSIANGTLPAWDSLSGGTGTKPHAGAALSAWFAALYFLYFFLGWTCTMIPYDALGMELTSDYDERVKLFSIKVLFQFVGYLIPNAIGLLLADSFANDILTNYAVQAIVLASLAAIALVIFGRCVHERPEAVGEGRGNNVPAVVAIRRLMSNRPYRIYLMIKAPLTLTASLPVILLPFFMRDAMHLEDWTKLFFAVNVAVIVGSFLTTPVLGWLARRHGKRTVLLWTSSIECALYCLAFLLEPSTMDPSLLYLFGFCVGLGAVVSFMIMDALLADVIDYDTLHTGLRSEGTYTVWETNLQQLAEMVGGPAAFLTLAAFGYENNGGCECGCGVKCDAPYQRWSCPADVGYACSNGFDAPPLFGDPSRVAPCVVQSNVEVVCAVRVFMFLLPGVLFGVAAAFAYAYPITKQAHAAILSATEAAARGDEAIDPLTGDPVVQRGSDRSTMLREHFSASELAALSSASSLRGLARRIGTRLVLWLALLLALVAAVASSGGGATEYLVTIGAILCSALFLCIPWDALRLRVAMDAASAGALLRRQGA